MSSSMRGGRVRKFKSEINVVPYIDVMLVLLVIFMVVAPLTTPGVVDLPSAEKTAKPPTEYIQVMLRPDQSAEISIKQRANWLGAQNAPTRKSLIKQLRDLHLKNPQHPVLIAADKASRYEDVIDVISAAKKLGIKRVGLATK